MEDIEVGEYVRTDDGEIGKVIKIKDDDEYSYNYYICDDDRANSIRSMIVKHSKNIIDLIEVGDYVNGHLIEEIQELHGKKCVFYDLDLPMQLGLHFYMNNDIKTIVAKEQFARAEYSVEKD